MKKMLALLLTSCLFLTACGGGKEAPTADGAATEEAGIFPLILFRQHQLRNQLFFT